MPDTEDKVSIIIPCLNGGSKIRRCVESILRDPYENIEIIIVDDGSADDTLIIIREIKDELHSKVRIVFQNRLGAAAARNRGVKYSSGKFIQFLDCDDYLINEKIQRSMDSFAADSSLLCVYTDGQIDTDHKKTFSACHSNIEAIISRKFKEFTFGMNTNMPIWNKILLQEEGLGWDENLPCWQEAEYYFRLLLKINNSKKIIHLAQSGFIRDIENDGISSKRNKSIYILGQSLALDKIIDLCKKEQICSCLIENQYCRFKFDLLKRSLVGGNRDAWLNTVPAVRRYCKNKSQKWLTYISFEILRIVYRVKNIFF